MMHIHANSRPGRHALLRELSIRLKEGPRVQGAILCNILGVIVTASVSQSPPGIFIEARCSDLLPNVLRHLDDSGPVEDQRSMMQRFVKELADSLERVKDFVKQYTDNQAVDRSDLTQRTQLATMRVVVNSGAVLPAASLVCIKQDNR
ncbi:hypothetical protein PENSPDRAFT_316010 [Peniophora sp. CONT]|nr:hypothetical protein PENSPDRAFT_316010 [Peniophora sp. CONT]